MAPRFTPRLKTWLRWTAGALLAVTGLLAISLFGLQAQAQNDNAAQKKSAGRFSMTPTPGGFLRLDTKTGAVSLCKIKNNAVMCQSSADERAALEAEIARLSNKNAKLEKQLKTASKSTGQRLRDILPSDKEMDKALTYAEKLMRRMMRIMREEEKTNDKI